MRGAGLAEPVQPHLHEPLHLPGAAGDGGGGGAPGRAAEEVHRQDEFLLWGGGQVVSEGVLLRHAGQVSPGGHPAVSDGVLPRFCSGCWAWAGDGPYCVGVGAGPSLSCCK